MKTNKDLIDRQAAIEKLISNLTYMHTFGADRSIDLIEDLPAVQPQQIVRCKDCRWHNGEINQCNAQVCASMYGEDFCSKGERREG